MKKRSTGSFLPPRHTTETAQKKAAVAITKKWAIMAVVIHPADCDEVPDAVEAADNLPAVQQVVGLPTECDGTCWLPTWVCGKCQLGIKAEEDFAEDDTSATIESAYRVEFEPLLSPGEAKFYARSAAPAYRGKMSRHMLRVADKHMLA